MVSSSRTASYFAAAVALAASCTTPLAAAFTTSSSNSNTIMQSRMMSTILHERTTSTSSDTMPSSDLSRRSFFSTVATASLAGVVIPFQPALAADTKESLIKDLNDSLSKITTIPSLVESMEWDKIRTTLKTPPVNSLWNLGESQNTLVRLAKETDDFELLEMKDELAISLQMTDQYSYDNNFIYYQPGNGKVKTKEPMEMANKAISQLKDALDVVNSS
ncbi:hypothetical protein ACHAXR_003126 [Thalassiosira sp. AJA248-18]